jgi:hypothetical protein
MRHLTSLVAAATAASTSCVVASADPRPICITGDAVPNAPAGYVFARSNGSTSGDGPTFSEPLSNARGDIVFRGRMNGPGLAAAAHGVMRYRDGTLETLLYPEMPTPDVVGCVFRTVRWHDIDDSGAVLVACVVRTAGVDSERLYRFGADGSVVGAPRPGPVADNLALSDAGDLLVVTNSQWLVGPSPAALTPLAVAPLPLASPAGATLQSLGTVPIQISNLREIAILNSYRTTTGATDTGVIVGDATAPRLVYGARATVPTFPNNTFPTVLYFPWINNAGAALSLVGVGGATGHALLLDDGTGFRRVLTDRDPAPGFPAGVVINFTGAAFAAPLNPIINARGQIGMIPRIAGAGFGGPVLYAGRPGELVPQVRSGVTTPVNDPTVRVALDTGSANAFAAGIAMNAQSQFAWIDRLTSGGRNGFTPKGILTSDPALGFRIVTRLGDPLPVSPGVTRIVRELRFTPLGSERFNSLPLRLFSSGLSDVGTLAFIADFDLGEGGIYVDTIRCITDFNGDGFTDFFDLDDFLACFEGASCPTFADSDFNADGFTDFFDFDDFVAAFERGC